jgi:putative addiction module component (TIGR02574 family)
MTVTLQSLGIDQMPIPERLVLVQEIWDSIAAESSSRLTESQRIELRRRSAQIDANPDSLIPWETVKAEAVNRIRK